jgi:hypothetical protein
MEKKYRLRIPKTISKKCLQFLSIEGWSIHWLVENEGTQIDILNEKYGDKKLPQDWMEEVKEDPISPEEWFKHRFGVNCGEYFFGRKKIIEAFKAGEENMKSRYKKMMEDAQEAMRKATQGFVKND